MLKRAGVNGECIPSVALAGLMLAIASLGGLSCSESESQPVAESTPSDGGNSLRPERPLDVSISPKQAREFAVEVEPGAVVRVVIDHRGREHRLDLLDGSDEVLRQTTGSSRTWGLETLTLRNPPGELTLRVKALGAGSEEPIRLDLDTDSSGVLETPDIETAENLLAEARKTRGASTEEDIAARDLALESAELAAGAEDRLLEAIANLEVASICVDTLDMYCVRTSGTRALDLAKTLGHQRLLEEALSVTALAQAMTGDMPAAMDLFEEMAELLPKTRSVRHQARAQIFLSACHSLRAADTGSSRDERAEAVVERHRAADRAIELFREAGDRLGLAETYTTLGMYFRSSGESRKTTQAYRMAEALIAEIGGHPRAEATLYNNVGVNLRTQSDYQGALDAYTRALKILEKTGYGPPELYWNLGQIHRTLGNYKTAIELFKKFSTTEPDTAEVGVGRTYLDQGKTEEALQSFEKSLDLNEGSQEVLAWALDGRGLAFAALEKFDKATLSLERSLDIYRGMRTPISEAHTLSLLADVAHSAGRSDRAAALAVQARDIAIEIQDTAQEASIDALLGKIEHRRGNLKEGLEHFDRATEAFESLRWSLGDYDQRAGFFASRQDQYLDFIALLADLAEKHPGKAFAERAYEISERARARSLVDMLRRSRWDSVISPSSTFLEEERVLNGELVWAQKQIEALSIEERPDPDRLDEMRDKVESLLAEKVALWKRIREEEPRYAELRSPSPASISDIQRLLAPSAALLQFALHDEESYLFVVTQEDVGLFVLSDGRDRIKQLCYRMRRSAKRHRAGIGEYAATTRPLYEALLAPASTMLERKNEWIVVPDGPLYSVPFEALPISSEDEEIEYLVERTSIQYVPSATTLVTLQSPRDSAIDSMGFLGFADAEPENRPLVGARVEVTGIAEMLRRSGRSASNLMGSSASEHALKTSTIATNARWLHFSTHGDFDEHDPAESGLALAPGGGEDGRLSSQEAFELKLNADLVVLSGCQTGLGKELRGEGVVGLTRAFLYAGAQNVIVSFWRVEDQSTSRLMLDLYEAISQDNDKPVALQAAKIKMIHSEEWSHPFFWAPFVLIGSA